MGFGVGTPAFVPSDIKVLYSNEGEQEAGASAQVNLDSFTLNPIEDGEAVYILTEQYPLTGTQGTNSVVTGTTAGTTGVCRIGSTTSHQVCTSVITKSSGSAGSVNFLDSGSMGVANGLDVNTLGNNAASRTIYFTMARTSASTYKWRWLVYKVKMNIK